MRKLLLLLLFLSALVITNAQVLRVPRTAKLRFIAPASVYVRQNLTLEETYEGVNGADNYSIPGVGNSAWQTEVGNGTYDESIVQARAGVQSAKFEIRYAWTAPGDRGREERKPAHETEHPSERWYGISVFLANWVPDDLQGSIFQWHDSHDGCDADGTPPTAGMKVVDGYYQFFDVADPNTCTTGSSYTVNEWGGPSGGANWIATSNVWTDFVIHVKWTWLLDGRIEIWKNGIKILDYTGRTAYNDVEPQYYKIGPHWWPWADVAPDPSANTKVLYVDEVRIGNALATYNDVKPGN